MMRVISPAPRHAWCEIVSDDPRALPEHEPAWIDAMTAMGDYTCASRLYELRDGRRFVLPIVQRRGVPGGWLGSFPPGWGIGGTVGSGMDAEALRAVIADLHAVRAARIVIRPDPLAADVWRDAVADSPAIAIPRRAHVLELSGGREGVQARLSTRGRRNIRTAERKGVTVETDGNGRLLPLYYQLFLRSVDRWAGRQHEPLALARWRAARRDPLEKLHAMSDALSGRMRVTLAFVNGRPAAGAIVLHGRSAHYTRAAMDRELAGPTCASAFAQWAAIVDAVDAGCTSYHMGDTGNSASLAAYKEQFGAVSVPYSEYRFERLPFTKADSLVRGSVKKVLRFQDA